MMRALLSSLTAALLIASTTSVHMGQNTSRSEVAHASSSLSTSRPRLAATVVPDSGQGHAPLHHGLNRLISRSVSATPDSGGVASLQPPALSLTIAPGNQATVPMTVSVPSALNKVDVLFMFDMTGSMASVIDANKSDANQIMNTILAQSPNTAFGAAYFDDYYFNNYAQPSQYGSYADENAAAGSTWTDSYSTCSGDTPWQIASDISTDVAAVQTSVDGIPNGCGGDYPEDQVRALWEAAQPDSIHWRSGAKRIVVLLTDAPAHDPSFAPPGTDSSGNPYPTQDYGWDPGRDGVIGTADDLRYQQAVTADHSAGITVIPVIMNYADDWTQAEYAYAAQQTGGTFVLADPTSSTGESNIETAIENAIGNSTSLIGNLQLQASDSAYASWVRTNPSSYTGVPSGNSYTFQTTVSVPSSTPPGSYSFNISANGDGSIVGTIPVVVTAGSPRTGQVTSTFDPEIDGFGFENHSSTQTQQMFAQEFGVPPSFVSRIAPDFLQAYLKAGSSGSCFGFSSASGINFLLLPQVSAGSSYALPTTLLLSDEPENSTIDQSLAFYQGSWYSTQITALHSLDSFSSVGDLLQQIETSISTGLFGTPVIVDMYGTFAHAVLAYKYTTGFTDPSHPGDPAVAVGVYDSNHVKDKSRQIIFWRDSNGWHWYYTFGNAIQLFPPKITSIQDYGPSSNGDSEMDVIPVQQATYPGTLPFYSGSLAGSVISYDGAGSLSTVDALGQTATIDNLGQISGDLPGIVSIPALDSENLPGTGLLYIPETSAFTVTASPTITGTISFGVMGTNGDVRVATTGDSSEQPLSAVVSSSAHDVTYNPTTADGRVAITFDQLSSGGLKTFAVSGLSGDSGSPQDVQVSPDGESISLTGGANGTPYSLAATQVDAAGVVSSTIVSGLTVYGGITETVQPDWTTPNGAVTLTDYDSYGNVYQTQVAPDAPLSIGDGQPVAPGDSVAITATDGTYSSGEPLTVQSDGLIAPQAAFATATGGANLSVTVPATATTGTYILTVVGADDAVRASRVINVVAPTVGPSLLSSLVTPQLTLTPSSGTAGTSFTITSTAGFSPTEPIDISMGGIALGTVDAASDGTLTANVVVPVGLTGVTTVTATGELSGLSATAPFTIINTPPSLTPTPSATNIPAPPTSVPPTPVPPTSTPTHTPPPPPPAVTNTPTHVPPPPPGSTPTHTPPPPPPPVPTATPVPPSAPCATPSLTLHVPRSSVFGGGTLPLTIRTAPGARGSATLQVTTTKTVMIGTGKHRKKVRRTVVLYKVTRHGTADRHGQLKESLRVAYQPSSTMRAGLTVTTRAACGSAGPSRRVQVTIQPLLTLLQAKRGVTSGGTLPFSLRTAPRAHVSATLRVLSTRVIYKGTGKHRKKILQTKVLYSVNTTGVAGAQGRFAGTLHVTLKPTKPVVATLTLTARAPAYGSQTLPIQVTIQPPVRHHHH